MSDTSSTIGRVTRNTGVIILGNVVGGLINLFTVALFVRYIGVEKYGIYAFIFAYLGFFGIFIDLGINSIIVREMSRRPDDAPVLLGNALSLKGVLSILVIGFACGVIFLLPQSPQTKVLACIASFSFLWAIGSLYRTVFQQHLCMHYAVFGDFIVGLLRCALYVLFVFLRVEFVWFILIEVFAGLPLLLLSAYYAHRYVRPQWQIRLCVWKDILKESWPLALSTVFIFFYFRIDQLMLFYMKGPEAVGFYAPTVKLTEAINIIPQAFTISLFPLFSRYFVSSSGALKESFQLSARLMMSFIIPVTVALTFIARAIMVGVFGEPFGVSAQAFVILMWAEIFIFAGLVNNKILIAIGKQRIDFVFTSTAAVINIVLNFLFIPRFGFTGAAVASLCAYAAGPIMNCVLPAIRSYGLYMFAAMIKPFIAAGVMAGIIYSAPSRGIITYVLAITAYGLVMIVLRAFSADEIRMVIDSVRRHDERKAQA